ncbi:hypothetical protein EMIHUDRAFT_436395 [Emiliania huxleyi CCMP1516]|uniref:Alpha-1,6-mannosyl-glycoprotein 6-beta-N-acetylglucosaminyltransferase n=2 Tax=Emiliania huxleyi TaxID=2903 RepID=A0A0D3J1K7_EMIH1|nr:hypothetical protein EMIHUDRAFT_436395 [Emiliania huxleyi CCMP1516]EOD17392.1 hypothetical protein EMIHUDRAFT_436395 [Emiliania huxleyi CCMP1516]|eukprot:XP_005769821.1 hypothetical protein EMIHUDRAFT_436395 [Emiliania huxleyi CCMP1516]
MYQFAQGQGEPVPVYQYSSGMAAQPYANQHWAEVLPGTVAPQGAPAGYFYDGAPSAEPLRYDSGYGMPYSQPALDEQCESDCADALSKATGACLLVPTPLIAIVAPICYLAVAEAQAHCDRCPEIMCYSMAPGRTVYKNWWGLFGSPDEEPFFPFANPGLDYECKNDWADMLPDWGGREALEGICDMCEPVFDKYGSGRGRSLLLDNLHMGLISTSVDTAVDTKVDVGKDTAAKALDEMSPETIRALGGRKGLASLDEAKVGLVAEQAKLHAQDKLRQGAVQAAASATGLDADTVGWLGSSVGALDYACDCGWTEDYACPSAEQPGRKGWAQDASTQCYKYCCEGVGSQLKSLEEIRAEVGLDDETVAKGLGSVADAVSGDDDQGYGSEHWQQGSGYAMQQPFQPQQQQQWQQWQQQQWQQQQQQWQQQAPPPAQYLNERPQQQYQQPLPAQQYGPAADTYAQTQQGYTPPSAHRRKFWQLGDAGQGCDAVCAASGSAECDVATLRGDEADEEYEVEGIAKNLLGQRCASSSGSSPSFAPAIDAAGGCLYANHGGRSCTVTSASHRRFCPCVVY